MSIRSVLHDRLVKGKIDPVTYLRANVQLSDIIEKAKGEGSRGGKIIGHTRSGKPIYDTHNHPEHKDYTADDHHDARNVHGNVMQAHGDAIRSHAHLGYSSSDPKIKREHAKQIKLLDGKRDHNAKQALGHEKRAHEARISDLLKRKDNYNDHGGGYSSHSIERTHEGSVGAIHKNGKHIGNYEFDRASDAFWVDGKHVGGGEGSKSYNTKEEMVNAFKKHHGK